MITWIARVLAPTHPHRRLYYIFFFVLFLSPLIVTAAYGYGQVKTELTERALSRREAIAFPTALALEEKLESLIHLGESFADHPRVREAILAGNWDKAIDLLSIFKTLTEEPFLDRIFLADAQGTETADFPELTGAVGKNFAFRDWYKGITATGKPYVSEIYRRTAEPQINVVAVAIPITDSESLLKGILVLQLRPDRFLDWLKDIDVGQGGLVYVVDQHGNLVAHPKLDPQGEIENFSKVPIIEQVLRGESGTQIQYNPIEKEERLAAYEPVRKYGWGVIVTQSTETAFAARNSTLRTISLVYVVALILNIFFIYLILYTILHFQKQRQL